MVWSLHLGPKQLLLYSSNQPFRIFRAYTQNEKSAVVKIKSNHDSSCQAFTVKVDASEALRSITLQDACFENLSPNTVIFECYFRSDENAAVKPPDAASEKSD